jgi:SAM-dependent methyltransferase
MPVRATVSRVRRGLRRAVAQAGGAASVPGPAAPGGAGAGAEAPPEVPGADGPPAGDIRLGLDIDGFAELFDAGRLSLAIWDQFSVDVPPPGAALAAEPFSERYHAWVMGVWRAVTGRDAYRPDVDEAFDVPPEEFLRSPWPYSSGDPAEVGRYMGAIAWMLRVVEPRPGSRVVELGSGWGLLALQLAMLGCTTTAVDLNPASVRLLRARADAWGVPLEVAQASFLDFDLPECDAIVFFESFHHCDRPFELIDRCRARLRPGGRILFLAEPFYDDFSCPWGVRTDGAALFMARANGWLELGYQRAFFVDALRARGFEVVEHAAADLGAHGTLLVASLPAGA